MGARRTTGAVLVWVRRDEMRDFWWRDVGREAGIKERMDVIGTAGFEYKKG